MTDATPDGADWRSTPALPDTDGRQAVAAAEGLRRAVSQARGPDGTPLTISIGVASTDDGGIDSVIELFHAADEALYQAKAAGRDRVRRARGSERPG